MSSNESDEAFSMETKQPEVVMSIRFERVPFIIAEIGINHNGSMDIARRLIELAKAAGCDAVKFQKRAIDVVYTKEFLDSQRESPWGTTQRAQKEALEFGKHNYDQISEYCREMEIDWFASAWDPDSQLFMRRYNLKYNKVASAMLTHQRMIEMIAEERKPTFISTGMSTYEILDEVVNVFRKKDCPFVLMHCVSTYPADDDQCNLNLIPALKKRYDCPVGYSGHERGVHPTIIAVALGAVAIERHITLDRTMYGSDQAASLEPKGIELVVREARSIQSYLGHGKKLFSEAEWAVASKLRYFETPTAR
jgi:N-acetylneuraminate synthase